MVSKLKTIIKLLLVLNLTSNALSQQTTPIIATASAVSASYTLYESAIETKCVESGNTGYRTFPTGQSIENFISLVERLELIMANATDPNLISNRGAEKVARLLLRRFRFDGFDAKVPTYFQNSRDKQFDKINTAFLGRPEVVPNLAFPDYVYTQDEQCSLFYMLSHNIINTTEVHRTAYAPQVFRGKRQTYNYNKRQQYGQQPQQYGQQQQQQQQYGQQRQYNPTGYDPSKQPVVSPFLNSRSVQYPIKEEGVVSFRGNKNEAIALARVLIGVIAGLAQNIKTLTTDVASAAGMIVSPNYAKSIDPVLAMTLGDLWGSGVGRTQDTDKTFYYGTAGEWASTSCTTHYSLPTVTADKNDVFFTTNKGTKAEIRGGIDGYLIGRALKSTRIDDPTKLQLSTVLRSYYSRPKMTKTTSPIANYCDRNSAFTSPTDLQTTAQLYSAILADGAEPPALLGDWTQAQQQAQVVDSNGYTDYCNKPSGTLTKEAPCETPSDVLFFIDGQTQDKLQISSDVVASVVGNLNNIRYLGGTVSIFFNSQGRNSINSNIVLPTGPGDWPLTAAAFNSTSTGCATCRIHDFNTTLPSPILANTGKLFLYMNTTLFNYEWWNPRTNYSAVPAKTAVIVDLGSVPAPPATGADRNDYNNYKDQLRYRHRDVRYLSVSTEADLFKDILRFDTDKASPGTVSSPNVNIGPQFAKSICENPATFQYNACNLRRSENIEYVGFVTPGYKQNWAMYPEFFLKSFDIQFKFKADDGEIKVCFDRIFPPEKNDENYCKELKSGEEKIFYISNPCNGRSFTNCDPFYFTVWGKDRTASTQCLDERCMSLDQIKFTVTHSGVQCNSSKHLLPSNTFQVIILFISAILYLSLIKDKN